MSVSLYMSNQLHVSVSFYYHISKQENYSVSIALPRIRAGTSCGVSMIEVALSQLLYHLNWELGCGIKPDELDMSETFGMGNMQEKT